MPLHGRRATAGTLMLNCEATNMAPSQKVNTSRGRGRPIFKHINYSGMKKNLGPENENAFADEDQQQFTALLFAPIL
jgi:hypothetical protein